MPSHDTPARIDSDGREGATPPAALDPVEAFIQRLRGEFGTSPPDAARVRAVLQSALIDLPDLVSAFVRMSRRGGIRRTLDRCAFLRAQAALPVGARCGSDFEGETSAVGTATSPD